MFAVNLVSQNSSITIFEINDSSNSKKSLVSEMMEKKRKEMKNSSEAFLIESKHSGLEVYLKEKFKERFSKLVVHSFNDLLLIAEKEPRGSKDQNSRCIIT